MTGTTEGALESSRFYVIMWEEFMKDVNGIVDEEKGVVIRWSDTSLLFFNVLTFDDAGINQVELEKRLEFGADYMQKRKEPGMFPLFEELLTEEARSKLQETYKKVGFRFESKEFGMVGDISTLQEPYHSELRFGRVRTEEDMKVFNTLNARANNVDPSHFIKTLKLTKLWEETAHAFIGYLSSNYKPVCCAAVFPIENILFLIGVATDLDHWRHGYCEAITRKALYESGKANDLTRVLFQSTEIGRPVYERIGMSVTCNIHTLMLQKEETPS